ncbi:LOW QUALITY PROTEIN: hypothetical protein Cgig2_017678 [Carnegiea gigantea]|uniref:Uncharacterized protein n=1 Tax=Carnegiea gigantea TaxID=171969 RepID=A0A9Q1GTE2_9CARY|nr:LOW QUALITY PROTEIN: hypothetical protein Cgig2_017678 [Carnegiea gigantea]
MSIRDSWADLETRDRWGWAEALLSALRILLDPTEEFKEIPAKFLLTICTEGNENKIYVEVASETCLWSKIEVGRRKEDSVAIGFGVVKGDEEDYIIDILKRRSLSLYNTLLSDYKNVVQCGVSTIYAPKKHIIKKQIEKGFKRHGEICNNATPLTGAKQMQMMSIIRLYMTLRGPHIYDDDVLLEEFIKFSTTGAKEHICYIALETIEEEENQRNMFLLEHEK